MPASKTSDKALFLDLAKGAFRSQVEKRVRPLARSYVERWMKCEFWLYPAVISRHATELRGFRPVVLEVLRKTTVDEVLEICRRARPDLSYLWQDPAAREKLSKELAESIKAVEAL